MRGWMGTKGRRAWVTAGLMALATLVVVACGDSDGDDEDVVVASDVAGGDVAADVAADGGETPELNLHVPSPDWRDQVIYFVMIDRFQDGDPSNNDQGYGEWDPSSNAHFSGGDIQGIIDRLDYIQSLGATAIWITPPVANQWWDPLVDFGGYHGYWARDFKKVDEHFGTLEDYQRLSHELHERGMYLIQDIVANHMGNFFSWDGPYDPENPTENMIHNLETVPTTAPEQTPFDMNDPNDPEHLAADIYHWTPTVADFNDDVQEVTWQLSDLDDLKTENPVVRTALKDSYAYWIENVGVDGFRIDTVKFVEHDFWNDFLHSTDADAPGIGPVAAATGRDDFLSFGEIFEPGEPMNDEADRKVTAYLGTEAKPELRAVLGFPLYKEADRIFTGGTPTSDLTFRLEKFMDRSLYRDPFVTPTFLDNHDVERFLGSGSVTDLRQALAFLMTVPGIPIIYYGTEQGFTETRPAMYDGGFLSGGKDHFDQDSDLYEHIAELTTLRRDTEVLRRGELRVLRDNPAGPGAFVFAREQLSSGADPDIAIVVFNTADETVLVADLATPFPSGTPMVPLFLENGSGMDEIVVGENGRASFELPARATAVFVAGEAVEPPASGVVITVTSPAADQTFSENFVIEGTVAPADATVKLVLDDYLDRARTVRPDADGNWTITVPVDQFPYGDTPHTFTLWAPDEQVAGPRVAFTASLEFDGVTVVVDDPLDDDHGPAGTYTYPQDATFSRQMDIEQVTVMAGAVTMDLHLKMREHSNVWSPTNGFDHVAFSIFFDVPGQEGLTFLPRLQATTPEGFDWDLESVAHGWGNSVFTTEGATEDSWGATAAGTPKITIDLPERTISLRYDGSVLGLATWEGVRVYVTAWDFDGIEANFRPISAEGGPYTFGGGDPADPYIMDDVAPIEIPALPTE